ncbi:MAG: M1 family metallopeptidase [archaeon]|nr:MAG: M1 family metallopeptidase [archaeon]
MGVEVNGKKAPFSHSKSKGILSIRGVPKKLSTVGIAYRKEVSDDSIFGLYKSKYGKDHLLATDLEPAEARSVFPCLDEPAFKAVFRLKVTTEDGLKVISNMPVASSSRTKDGRRASVFQPTPKMSTYLFFLGVGKFDEATTTAGRSKVIVASRPGQADNTRFIGKVCADVLEDFGKYFGIPYPLPKLHLVALPEYHTGAMENWGAIASRESLVLVRPDSSLSDHRSAARVQAHEIAHMWFGDLVTMKWWDDLWLNESFATFMSAKVLSRLHPDWDPWRDFLRAETFRALNVDALSSTHPIQVQVNSVEEINGLFDTISYGKGAAVLRMLEAYVGDEPFRKGISAYLKKFRYSNAAGSDLWNALGRASGLPVSRVAKAWLTIAGFPVVRAKASKGKLSLTQSKFKLTGKESKEVWPIPLTFDDGGRQQRVLFDHPSTTVKAARPERLVLNSRRTGFYSVLYDEAMYRQLAKGFSSLHSHDRAGIINDLYLFIQAGIAEPAQYFRFVALASKLKDPLISLAISDQLHGLRAIASDAETVRKAYHGFFESQLRLVGLTPKPKEEESAGIVREAVAMLLAKASPSLAAKLAQKFDDFESVDPNLKEAVVVGYAMHRGPAAFGPLVDLLGTVKTEVDRGKVYGALTSLQPSLVEKTLDMTLDGEVSRSDSGPAFRGAYNNPASVPTLWGWVAKNYEKFRDVYGGTQQFYLYMGAAIPRIGIGHEAEVRSFISGKRYKGNEMTFRRAFEQLEVNARLRRALLAAQARKA